MSGYEIAVVIILGFTGYWITSSFLQYFDERSKSSEKNSTGAKNSTQQNLSKNLFSDEKQWYEILDIKEDSTIEEIRVAYKYQISKYQSTDVESLGLDFSKLVKEKIEELDKALYQAINQKKL
jgi:hypothetical protein